MFASWGMTAFWIIFISLAVGILGSFAVSMITRSFLKAKYDSRIEYLDKLKNKEQTKSTRRQ